MEQAIAVRGLDTFLTNWQQRQEVANMLIKSKFLPPAYTSPEQVIAVMLVAHELNVPEMEAIRGINVIQGKPTISPQLMLALINRSGQLEDMKIDDDGNACHITMKRRGRSPVTVSFSMQDAANMGLTGKDNWKKQGKIMRQWRAMSAAGRLVFPDVISGMYTTEELDPDAIITEDGEQISQRSELVHAEVIQEDHYTQDSPQPQTVVVDNKTVGVEFNPTKEPIAFGKHKGMLWADVPTDYLQYVCASPGKNKEKAEATLKYIETYQAQKKEAQGDITDEMFGKKDDPAQEKSTALRKLFEAKITNAKVNDSLGTIVKQINAKCDEGEILMKDATALMDAIDKKSRELHPPKKEKAA